MVLVSKKSVDQSSQISMPHILTKPEMESGFFTLRDGKEWEMEEAGTGKTPVRN